MSQEHRGYPIFIEAQESLENGLNSVEKSENETHIFKQLLFLFVFFHLFQNHEHHCIGDDKSYSEQN